MTDSARQLRVRGLGSRPYSEVWREMRAFTDGRTPETPDELWLVEHPPVFTLGQAGKSTHILQDIGIPVVKSDRGGQVTYHGPGQLVGYTLFDLRRLKIGVRDLVTGIETSIVQLLSTLGISSAADPKAPGVYVQGAKIAALGLRVRRGCSYHGFSINLDLDLTPFQAINPCGYEGLAVTRLVDLGAEMEISELEKRVVNEIAKRFQYDSVSWQEPD